LKTVDCKGYRTRLTPWECIENQLSIFCLPGWPCHTCPEARGLGLPPDLTKKEAACQPERQTSTGKQVVNYDPKTMSRAVARAMGLI